MLKSKDAYKARIAANPDNPDKCEALKRAYEADLKAYEATSRGIRPGGTISIEKEWSTRFEIQAVTPGEPGHCTPRKRKLWE